MVQRQHIAGELASDGQEGLTAPRSIVRRINLLRMMHKRADSKKYSTVHGKYCSFGCRWKTGVFAATTSRSSSTVVGSSAPNAGMAAGDAAMVLDRGSAADAAAATAGKLAAHCSGGC